jgi:hypothetical protein
MINVQRLERRRELYRGEGSFLISHKQGVDYFPRLKAAWGAHGGWDYHRVYLAEKFALRQEL